MKNEFNKNKNNNKSSYVVQNTRTFDGTFLREKLIINKFKRFFILQIISIIQFILGISSTVLSGVYLSQFLSSRNDIIEYPDYYKNSTEQLHQLQAVYIPICAVFLTIGLVILVENFILIPILCYSIAKSQKPNFDFILKKINSTYLKANVRVFLTSDSTFNIVWYCMWFAFISIPYNIYEGLKYTYEHTKSNPNLKANNNKANDNNITDSSKEIDSSTSEPEKDEDEKK